MRMRHRRSTLLCRRARWRPLLSSTARRHGPRVQERGGQEEFGPYEPVPNWPQPLPDGPDGVKHDGWTWGSVGAVFAETPDRIWIAQRGELPLPAGAKPWTPYAHAQPVARQRHRQRRWPGRDVRAGRQARLGAPLSPRDLRRRSRRQDGAVVAAARQAVRGAVRPRPAQDQDEPVRPREARVGLRRSAPRHPQVHLRRQAGDDARHQGPARPRRRHACSIGRPTSRGCPTAPSSSATATAARASPSSTRTASS